MHFICDGKCIYKFIWQVYITISLTLHVLIKFWYIWYYSLPSYDMGMMNSYQTPIFSWCRENKKLCTFFSNWSHLKWFHLISLYFFWNRKEETDRIITFIYIYTHKQIFFFLLFFTPVILLNWSYTFNYFLNWHEIFYYIYQYYFWSSTTNTQYFQVNPSN